VFFFFFFFFKLFFLFFFLFSKTFSKIPNLAFSIFFRATIFFFLGGGFQIKPVRREREMTESECLCWAKDSCTDFERLFALPFFLIKSIFLLYYHLHRTYSTIPNLALSIL